MFEDILNQMQPTGKRKKKLLSAMAINKANGTREHNDFYRTPAGATIKFLEQEQFEGDIWEPCCGDGAISIILIEHGYKVRSTDLIDRGYGEGGVNFLMTRRNVDNIITNPPFKNALQVIGQAKQCAKKKIGLLLPLPFLENKKRYGMFKDTDFPFKCIYQFVNRITCIKHGDELHKENGMMAFAWFVWDKDYIGKPYINWIL